MPALEQEVTEAEEQYKASQAVSGLNDRVKQLKDEQAWGIIVKAERVSRDAIFPTFVGFPSFYRFLL